MENFEIAIEAEYKEGMIEQVTKILEEKIISGYTKNKVVVIKFIDLK